MEKSEFLSRAEDVGRKANVLGGVHSYFTASSDRLYENCKVFDLFERPLGDVLEIGPFYGYVPFILRPRATSYSVLEGDDPVVYPLKPVYEDAGIHFRFADFFEDFGPTKAATHRLDAADGSFDSVLCWETMEHFNFNPVKFVREIHRVLKPSGRAFITVPNRAYVQNLATLITGFRETTAVDSYYQFEDYETNGKKAFFGFHWHEYTPNEIQVLFERAGFAIDFCRTTQTFSHRSEVGLGRQLARQAMTLCTSLFPRLAPNICLTAVKK